MGVIVQAADRQRGVASRQAAARRLVHAAVLGSLAEARLRFYASRGRGRGRESHFASRSAPPA